MPSPLEQAFSESGRLAAAHEGFVARPGQQALAQAVAQALQERAMLVAEAGTGTGKTYAYLVPALLSGGRVVISTGTRTLQDQLFERDLPRVRDALGVSVRIALLKGRANYVCLHHLQRNLVDGRFARREDIAQLARIDRFSRITDTGDRAALPGVPEDAPAWALATSTAENCLGQECAHFAACFVLKARQAAQQADIVVVNHHLLCADLALREEGAGELLPKVHAVIVDEAHQLPEVATQFFGTSVSTRQLIELSRDTLRAGLSDARDSADWSSVTGALEQAVRQWRLCAGSPARLDRRALQRHAELLEALDGCAAALQGLATVAEAAAERSRDLGLCATRAAQLRDRLAQWCDDVREAGDQKGALRIEGPARDPAQGWDAQDAQHGRDAQEGRDAWGSSGGNERGDAREAQSGVAGEPAAQILWAEVSAHGCTLTRTPLSVAQTFSRHRELHPQAWVFLSATLTVSGSLEHYVRQMGLEGAQQQVLSSPFDYAQQALLYVPRAIGLPSAPDFAGRLVGACWPLLAANGGRAFVLCTTLRMVGEVCALLKARIAEQAMAFTVLQQGESPRGELLERFRQQAAPILVGSASFWEGVDVQGEQLSLVIIDKLPFAPPDDPIVQARAEAVRRQGEDAFRVVHLPAAAMALKQGAGRLIRSERDRGLLVVCDERLAEKAYGRSLLKSLPPFRRTREAAEALAFIEAREATARTSTRSSAQ
jgi:ATP-dependent DNA helicase DinG